MNEDPRVSYSVKELLAEMKRDLHEEMREGFAAITSRLDAINGRVMTNEKAIANIRGRAVVAGAIAGAVATFLSAVVGALVLRGLGLP